MSTPSMFVAKPAFLLAPPRQSQSYHVETRIKFNQFDRANDPIISQIYREKGRWGRFKACIKPKTILFKKITELSKGEVSTQEHWKKALEQIVEGVNSPEFESLKEPLRSILAKLQREQFEQVLSKIAEESLKTGDRPVRNVLQLLALSELEPLLKGGDADLIQKLIETYAKLAQQDVALLPTKPSSKVKSFLQGLISTILVAFSFFQIGREPAGSWEASHMLEIYAKLIAIPVFLFVSLGAILSPLNALLVTAIIIAAMVAAIMVYNKWFRPCPDEIVFCNCINLTAVAKRGDLAPVRGRDKEISEVFRNLDSSHPAGRNHPILFGETGVGKSEILRGMAYWIATGHPSVPEKLRNKQVYVVSAVKLVDGQFSQESMTKLMRLKERLKDFSGEVILCIEDLDVAVTSDGGKLAYALLPLTDTSEGNFPYVVATNTKGGFLEKIAPFADGSLKRRFPGEVDVKSMDDKLTLLVLRELAREEAPELDISEMDLAGIYKEASASGQPMPNAAKLRLADLIAKRREAFVQPNLPEYGKLISECEIVRSQLRSAEIGSEGAFKLSAQLHELESDLQPLTEKYKIITQHLRALYKLKVQKAVQDKIYRQLAFTAKNDRTEFSKKQFLFHHLFVMMVAKQQINNLSDKVKLNYEEKHLYN